jgi:uncharacterized protein (TIGR02118 family)
MAVKLVVLYSRPKDVEAFETVYNRDHVPTAVDKLAGKTKIVTTKILGSPQGTPAFHRVAEIHFPSRMPCKLARLPRVVNRQSLTPCPSHREAHQRFS